MERYYKHLVIKEVAEPSRKRKTKAFNVMNRQSGILLGHIGWYGPWRQYCFIPADDTVFSSGCMLDIADFIRQL
jgi:hypothetical protein